MRKVKLLVAPSCDGAQGLSVGDILNVIDTPHGRSEGETWVIGTKGFRLLSHEFDYVEDQTDENEDA